MSAKVIVCRSRRPSLSKMAVFVSTSICLAHRSSGPGRSLKPLSGDCAVTAGPRSGKLLGLLAMAILPICLVATAGAQSDPTFETGVKPFGSYDGGNIDTINLSNGMVTLDIPLISYPQRGKLKLDLVLHYQNLGSYADQTCSTMSNGNNGVAESCTYDSSGSYQHGFAPLWQGIPSFQESLAPVPTAPSTQNIFVNVAMPDGAVHMLQPTSATTWESTDGSGFQLYNSNGTITITDSDGIRYIIQTASGSTQTPSGSVSGATPWSISQGGFSPPLMFQGGFSPPLMMEDTNGNWINLAGSNGVTDTMGRVISWGGTTPPNYSGCPTGPGLQTVTSATIWNLPGVDGGNYPILFCFTSMIETITGYPEASGIYSGNGPLNLISWQLQDSQLQSVVLPNGKAWNFQYTQDRFADLAQVTFPSGGTLSYTWYPDTFATSSTHTYENPRVVATRTLNPNDSTSPAGTWSYSYDLLNTSSAAKVTDPNGNDTVHLFTRFGTGGGFPAYYETQATYYQGPQSNNAVLKTVSTSYTPTNNCVVPMLNGRGIVGNGGIAQIASSKTTTWANGQANGIQYNYDSGFSCLSATWGPNGLVYGNTSVGTALYGKITSQWEYDYGAPGSNTWGPLLKQTLTNYAWQAGNPNYSSYLANNLLNLPTYVDVLNGTGVPNAFTNYVYDGSGLQSSGVTEQKAAGEAYPGNLTSVSRWLNGTTVSQPPCNGSATPNYLVSNFIYYDTGEVQQSTDPGGCSTTYQYSPAYYGAYPTTITNALNQSSTYTYDFTSGLLTSITDPNSATTSMSYDILMRPTRENFPDGGSTSYCYTDVGGSTCEESGPPYSVVTAKAISQGVNETSTVLYDGLGRIMQTQLNSDPVGPVYTNTAYDALGRVQSVSNPFRSTGDSTYGITSYSYDALNRQLQQTQPDNSYQSWSYTGNVVTFQDEVGNQWQRTTDGLGRLTKVLEPNGSSQTPSMETDYGYDALNNLLSVMQWGGASGSTGAKSRSFTYDSLSRLLLATNPESGTVTYSYDPNGNVSTKTDARSIQTSYFYDPLNRVTEKRYPTTGDPSACMQYDTPLSGASDANPIGRLTAEWTVPDGTCAAGNHSGQPAKIGAIPATAYNSTVVLQHDAMGREKGNQQCPYLNGCGSLYTFTNSYDLAGDTTLFTNGMTPANSTASVPAIAWTASYDGAARLVSLQASTQPWADPAHPPYLLSNLAYDPFNHIVSEQAALPATTGTPGLAVLSSYDNRGRITSEVAGGSDFAAGSTVTTPGKGSVGDLAVGGTETGVATTSATPGTGVISVTGADGTQTVCFPVTIKTGPTTTTTITVCTTEPDTGSLSVTIDGFTATASYASGTSDITIAENLCAAFNVPGSPVMAPFNDSVDFAAPSNSFTVTAIATGAATNYPITISNGGGYTITDSNSTLTGGQDAVMVYDAGTVTATITNNAVSPAASYTTAAVPWGGSAGYTANTLAANLASAINSAAGSLVTAKPNGNLIDLTSNSAGVGTDYSVTVNVVDTMASSYPTLFTSPSFTLNDVSMGGGEAAESAIYSYTVPPPTPTTGYAKNGNLLSYADSVMGAWSFQYDKLNRLAQATSTAATGQPANPYPDYCWNYDLFGNRTTQMSASVPFASGMGGPNACSTTGTLGQNVWAQYTGTTNGTNNQMSATNQNPSQGGTGGYDASGNVLNDGMNQYAYDAEGRLCAVENLTAHTTTQYLYDASGLRVGKGTFTGTFPAKNTSCAAPGAAAGFTLTNLYLLNASGDQVTELNTSTGTMAWAHSNIWAGAHLDATYDLKGLHFRLADPLGSRRVQTNVYGQVEENCQSLPFGDALNCIVPSGAPATADDATEHHFTGKERDTESGNDYFGARYYASTMGRFLSPDWSSDPEAVPFADIGNPQSLNLYAYVNNNPLRSRDPDGHSHQECVTFKILDTGVSVTTCTTVPDWRDIPMLAGIAWGHHGIPRSLFRFLPEGEARTWLQREFITGPLEGGHGWSKAHKLYNEEVKKLLKLDTAEGRQQLLDEGLDGAKEAARTVLNSNDPNIKGFLDGMKTPDGLTGRQALEGALEGDEGALLDVVIDGAAGLAAVD
jgi:RHS repeat-associated protein